MTNFGKINAKVYKPVTFEDTATFNKSVIFAQGSSGVQVVSDSEIWYVDKYKSSGATGEGRSWADAFLTITEAVAAAGDYDVIFIGAGTYSEKLTITQYGLKMFGAFASSGHQSFTTISAALASAAPCITITTKGKQEIAGINFNQLGAKAAIQLGESGGSGLYSIHIHDCRFDGNDVGLYGISNYQASNPEDCPDLVVDNCLFRGFVTASIVANSTRSVYRNNTIWVNAASIGIDFQQTGGNRPDCMAVDNYIIGSNSTDTGIKIASTEPTDGTLLIANNVVTNCNLNITQDKSDAGVVNNGTYADGAALAQVDPNA